MFLITELDDQRLKASEKAHRDDGGPEPDAQRPIEILLEQFSSNFAYGNLDYSPERSSVNPRESQEQLRAIAGATYEHWKLYDGQMPPLLDGLAINLFRKLFINHPIDARKIAVPSGQKGLFRPAASEEIGISGMLDRLKDPTQWMGKLKSNSTREMVFLIPLVRSIERVTFSALVDRLGDPSTVYPESITSVKIGKSDRWNMLENEFQMILNDQIRRIELAARYKRTPRGPGMPAWLRAEVKSRLDSIGIRNGDYSRAGFSSGRFPDLVTRSRVESPRPITLVFSRCEQCRRVSDLSCESDSRHIEKSVAKISQSSIAPWHERSCRSSEPQLDPESSYGMKHYNVW